MTHAPLPPPPWVIAGQPLYCYHVVWVKWEPLCGHCVEGTPGAVTPTGTPDGLYWMGAQVGNTFNPTVIFAWIYARVCVWGGGVQGVTLKKMLFFTIVIHMDCRFCCGWTRKSLSLLLMRAHTHTLRQWVWVHINFSVVGWWELPGKLIKCVH